MLRRWKQALQRRRRRTSARKEDLRGAAWINRNSPRAQSVATPCCWQKRRFPAWYKDRLELAWWAKEHRGEPWTDTRPKVEGEDDFTFSDGTPLFEFANEQDSEELLWWAKKPDATVQAEAAGMPEGLGFFREVMFLFEDGTPLFWEEAEAEDAADDEENCPAELIDIQPSAFCEQAAPGARPSRRGVACWTAGVT